MQFCVCLECKTTQSVNEQVAGLEIGQNSKISISEILPATVDTSSSLK